MFVSCSEDVLTLSYLGLLWRTATRTASDE
jgi:hypothetical protein